MDKTTKQQNKKTTKQQAAVALQYGGSNLNFIPQSAQERYKLAVLAIGGNPQLNAAKFVQLNEKPNYLPNGMTYNESIDEQANVPHQNKPVEISEEEEQRPFNSQQDEPITVKKILKLHHEVTADIELKLRNEDNNFKKRYLNFLRTYQEIVTKCCGHSPDASLASAFVYFGKQPNNNLFPVLDNGSRIPVQPTSISLHENLA
jgi:hypothetical protein